MSPTLLSALAAIVFVLPADDSQATSAANAEAKIALTVRYVGSPNSARGRSFVEFLESNFARVQATDRSELKSPQAAVKLLQDADVLLVDSNLTGMLPPAYSKPMVVLSGPGVLTAESQGAKLDWL